MESAATKIKIALLRNGVSGADIARELGITRQAVYNIIGGWRKTRRIRLAICRATGLPWSIWEEYDRKEVA